MPTVMLSVPETHETIVRPTAINVSRQLLKQTGLPAETTVLYIGNDKQAVMKGSKVGEKDSGVNSFSQTNRFRIDLTETYLEQYALASAVTRTENVLVFSDRDLGVSIKPAYTRTEVTLSVQYRADDRQSAERWRDDIRARASMMRDVLQHDLKYHYPIPKEYLVILNHINDLKEKQGGYGETLSDWFKRCFTPRVTRKVTLAGEHPTLAINEKQVGVPGQFDFEFVPEKSEKNDDAPSWVVSFDYRFVYDKPTSVIMEYPLLVHNQLISSRFRSKEPPYHPEQEATFWSLSRHVFDEVRGVYDRLAPVAGYSVPPWDDWLPKFVPPFTTTMFQIMLAADPEDPQALMSFSDLYGDFELDEQFIEFLKQESPWLNTPGESVALVTLYRDEIPLEGQYVQVDDQLTVRSTVPLDLRRRYHVRISLVNDLFTLSRRAKERLRRNGELCRRIMRALYPQIEEKGKMPKVIGNDYIAQHEFTKSAQAIKDTSRPHQSNIEITRLHVGEFIINAKSQ